MLVPTEPGMVTVYLAIGNSDDKLSQSRWSAFIRDIVDAVRQAAVTVHGEWYSAAISPSQTACFCVELTEQAAGDLKAKVQDIREAYDQAAIAWVQTTQTEFV